MVLPLHSGNPHLSPSFSALFSAGSLKVYWFHTTCFGFIIISSRSFEKEGREGLAAGCRCHGAAHNCLLFGVYAYAGVTFSITYGAQTNMIEREGREAPLPPCLSLFCPSSQSPYIVFLCGLELGWCEPRLQGTLPKASNPVGHKTVCHQGPFKITGLGVATSFGLEQVPFPLTTTENHSPFWAPMSAAMDVGLGKNISSLHPKTTIKNGPKKHPQQLGIKKPQKEWRHRKLTNKCRVVAVQYQHGNMSA